jgi:ubiquinone/menaquinone biosynthesis C-methylase UbiE
MTAAPSLRDYYARRAAEYEQVYAKPERQDDLRAMQAWIATLFAGHSVLEIACGTGWWTPHAAREAKQWLATDIAAETMAIAQTKPTPPSVRFAQMDAYTLEGLGDAGFDAAFAGFWWSHVPRQNLDAWLEQLHAHLMPGARVVFIDNRYVPGSSTPISRRDMQGNTYQQRRLNDGSLHEVLKNFPTRDEAVAALGPRATQAQWHEWTHYWALSYIV